MNIFCLDPLPSIAAQYHCDKHTIKMIVELTQILSTAHRVLDGVLYIGKSPSGRKQTQYIHINKLLYKATHMNHPSAKYVRDDAQQYIWTTLLLRSLCDEYTYRYGKVHKSDAIGLVDWLGTNIPTNIPTGKKFELPYPAMPADCIIQGDVVGAYRKYYMTHKRHIASWEGKINSRPIPVWYK